MAPPHPWKILPHMALGWALAVGAAEIPERAPRLPPAPAGDPGEAIQGSAPGRRPARDELKPWADLSNADLSGMDLSHLNLTGIILVGADLRGANLRFTQLAQADLTHADLRQAQLYGATLGDARLCMARILGATGLNPAGAALHPFFAREPGEAVGTLKLYQLPDDAYRPQQIRVGSRGDLFILQRGAAQHWLVTPTGFAAWVAPGADAAPAGGQRLQVQGPGARISCIMHGAVHLLEDHALEAKEGESSLRFKTRHNGVSCAVAVGADRLWTALPECMVVYRLAGPKRNAAVQASRIALPGFHLHSLAATPDGSQVFGLDTSGPRLAWFPTEPPGSSGAKTPAPGALRLPAGSLPRSLTWGSAGRMWFLAPGLDAIGWARPEPDAVCCAPLTALPGVSGAAGRRLHSLVQGPDGAMWFTQQSPPGIGRISADGRCRLWPLEAGMLPEDLAAGRDGKLYFTLAGQAAIGSIQALGPAADPDGREAVLPGLAWAQPVAPVEPVPAVAPSAPPAPETKAPPLASAKSAPSPRSLLAAMGWHFDHPLHGQRLDRLEHILKAHGYDRNPDNSQFLESFSSAERLPALIHEGLRRAVEIGRVVRRYDPPGMAHTPCDMGRPVGYVQVWNPDLECYTWELTHHMDVVTRTWRMPEGGVRQVIWTAFPCSPHRF